ncbi:cation:proton antiporter [Streptomyces sp. NPDC046727]|uniref:cation:proton antiporter domain-containing protein n=1 Tax=Streptomyces sp. NPDC046727 TaxID=3155373 RepID=UPI0033CAB241
MRPSPRLPFARADHHQGSTGPVVIVVFGGLLLTGTGRLLLPAYFVLAGMRVDLSHGTAPNLGELVLMLVVAIAGKTVGTYAAARACAVPRLQSTVSAALMNTRGPTETVILTTGANST